MAHKRSKNLSDGDVADIVSILDGWSGKLTWDLLIEAIEKRKRAKYTRQALHAYERIQHAFALRKKALSEGGGVVPKVESPELQAALQRIARLEGENARLEDENRRFHERFVTWAYNAHTRGMDEKFLNRQLPSVNRDQTFRPKVKPARR